MENGAPKDLRIERALGVTEVGSIVSNWWMADPPDWTEGYQGRLEPNFEAKVMACEVEDENGVREVEPHQAGELWVKSPSCVQGYYKNPEATKEQFTNDGWYKTGDVGFFRGDKLYLLDRKKVRVSPRAEMITSNRLRISSKHPTISNLQTSRVSSSNTLTFLM